LLDLPATADPTPQQVQQVNQAVAAITGLLNRPEVSRTPTVNWPTGLTATEGQTLANITLPPANTGITNATPGTFSWVNPAATIGTAGSQTHQLRFTPTDTAAFETVTQNVTVTVAATTFTPNQPPPGTPPGQGHTSVANLDDHALSNTGIVVVTNGELDTNQDVRRPVILFDAIIPDTADFPEANRNAATVTGDPRLQITQGPNRFTTDPNNHVGCNSHAIIMNWVPLTQAQIDAINAAPGAFETVIEQDAITDVPNISTYVTVSVVNAGGNTVTARVRVTFAFQGTSIFFLD
jgi:hypothetical protein